MELVFYLTNMCNMQCKYCYEGRNKKETILDFDVAKITIDEFSKNNEFISISFFGGEPLLNKDLLYKIVNYCEEKSKKEKIRFGYSITTNGVLIDDDFTKFCKKNNISVGISIDGTKECHNKNRLDYNGNSTYDSTLNGLKTCIDNKTKVMALPVVCLNNVDEMASNLECFIELGVKEVTFNFNYNDDWNDESLEKLKYQYERINDIYVRELKNGNRISVFPIDTKIVYMLNNNGQCTDRCNLNRTCVDSDGSYYPCIQFVGNKKYKIGDAYSGVDNIKRLELVKTRNKSKNVCIECALKKYCAYNCGCIRLQTTNDIVDIAPIVCETEKIYINIANDLIKKIESQNDFVKFLWLKS